MGHRTKDASPLGATRKNPGGSEMTAVGFDAGRSGADETDRAPLRLKLDGMERLLPERIFGFNTVVPYDVPYEDPAMVPVVRRVAPHYLRVPGGTVANYFNWRTGKLEVPDVTEGASFYRRFLVDKRMPYTKKMHPDGVQIETLKALADAVGADLVIVPNLETSSPAEQAAWFAHMRSVGVAPYTVEMGNEFYHALLLDAESLKVWPDYTTSMRRMKAHLDAFERHLPPNARIAVQASASRFHNIARPEEYGRYQRGWDWDDALAPEPWFNAVTAHMYTTFSVPAGPDAMKGLPGTHELIYAAMLAHTHDGFERNLQFLEEKLPGKEIWVTEWGGFDPAVTFEGIDIKFDGAWLNMVARGMLIFLRHPCVTITTYHSLSFAGNLSAVFRRVEGGGYEPTTSASLLGWFHAASRGPGVRYTPVTAEGARRIEAHTVIPGESFTDIEGGLFRKGVQATLIIQNAWMVPRTVSLAGIFDGRTPSTVETMGSPNLTDAYEDRLPPIRAQRTGLEITLPQHSITRVTWN